MIQILVTGGTLDKDYHPLTGELFFPETHLPQMLEQANITVDTHIDVVMQKDSLEMTTADRQNILEACLNSSADKIIITHGTDTMPETARYLEDSQLLKQKTIILTGAMRPFKLGHSDALFNLGSAFLALKITRSGVYIAMNGDLFPAREVVKNRDLGVFEV